MAVPSYLTEVGVKSESDVQREIIKALEDCGWLVFRMNAGGRKAGRSYVHLAPKGTPDLLAVPYVGAPMWVEVKREGGELREDQIAMLADLRKRGQRVLVARSVDDVMDEIGRFQRGQ
jgi:hypothetical protein